jgi:8-oxo-dGTP pyrophosphatase MutT (NUDIX family)/phosphohistidine phosphatase SixA
MSIAIETTVYAAGAVCWREIDDEIQVLLIHRAERRDISLPKGKVDPGEMLPQTAVREIQEETGLLVALGVPLGVTEYIMPSGRNKIVHYWAAEVTDKAILTSSFVPNDEVAALEWMPIDRARKELSYDPDRIILDNFSALLKQKVTETFAIIVLRHAKALDPASFKGADVDRPLSARGKRQADSIVGALSSWGPRRLVASTSLRCRQTMAPLGAALKRDVKFVEAISQHAFHDDSEDVRSLIGKRVRSKKTAVICSHGPVIPELIREIALATGTPLGNFVMEAGLLDTASFSVIHLSKSHPASGIIAIETHDALL